MSDLNAALIVLSVIARGHPTRVMDLYFANGSMIAKNALRRDEVFTVCRLPKREFDDAFAELESRRWICVAELPYRLIDRVRGLGPTVYVWATDEGRAALLMSSEDILAENEPRERALIDTFRGLVASSPREAAEAAYGRLFKDAEWEVEQTRWNPLW